MIRPFTIICMVLAGASGLYLYQTKHRAQMLDREIQRTVRQTDTRGPHALRYASDLPIHASIFC